MEDRTKKRMLLGSAAGCAFGMLVGTAARAEAYYTRYNPAMCQFASPITPHSFQVSDGDFYLQNDSTSNAGVVCPIPDNTGIQQENLTTIEVNVTDDNTAVTLTARACSFDAATMTSGNCGAAASANPPFQLTRAVLKPSVSALTTAGETAYLWLVLPRILAAGGRSAVNSIYFGQ